MPGQQQLTRIEHRVEIETTPERVFAVLTDPNNIVRYAGGIEGAEVLEMPNGPDDFRGAKLQLVTKSNNMLHAEVIEAVPHKRLVIRDERGVVSTWTITPTDDRHVLLENVVEGPIPATKANSVRYDCDVKFQAFQRILENDA